MTENTPETLIKDLKKAIIEDREEQSIEVLVNVFEYVLKSLETLNDSLSSIAFHVKEINNKN